MIVPYEEHFKKMELALQSKREELQLYEYQGITTDQLWRFCVEKKWRKKNIQDIRTYEMVATILSIRPAEFMQYRQMDTSALYGRIVELNMDELNLLLGNAPSSRS